MFDSEVVKYGRLNETMELECTMETEPAPTFKWYRHSSERGKEEWEDIINEGTYKSVAVVTVIFLKRLELPSEDLQKNFIFMA